MLWGWACALVGSLLPVPQVARLLTGRTSAGVSLLMWQLLFGAGIAWSVHGFITGHLNLIVPNVLSTIAAALVLRLVGRDRSLPASRVWPVGLGVGAALVAVEVAAGAAAFGVVVIAPFLVGLLGQTRDLLRSPDLSGLSPAFVIGFLTIQVMWWSWALAAHEASTLICSSVVGLLGLLNVALLAGRRAGLLVPAAARQAVAEAV